MQQLAEIGELAARTVQPHDAATRIIGSQLAACPATLPRAVGGRDNATCDVSGWLGRRRHVDRVEHTGKLPTCYRPLPLHCLGRPGAHDTAQSTCECEQASVCAGAAMVRGHAKAQAQEKNAKKHVRPMRPRLAAPSLAGRACGASTLTRVRVRVSIEAAVSIETTGNRATLALPDGARHVPNARRH